MATVLQSLRRPVGLAARRAFVCPKAPRSIGLRRAFSTTQRCQRHDEDEDSYEIRQNDRRPPRSIEEIRKSMGFEYTEYMEDIEQAWKDLDHLGTDEGLEEWYEDNIEAHEPLENRAKPKLKRNSFLNMGEHEPFDEEGMELEEDIEDLPAMAERELEQHRELRHYARLAAWEMPLLAQFARPFEPPKANQPLRFRYTTYMGEKHPAAKKVVLEFSPADMPNLTDIQRLKLKKLCGFRYNPELDIVKMSCEMFETQNQNKRYLGDLVDKLLKESREGDMFEDVPLNVRHHHFKNKPKFPKEWYMTPERRAELDQIRQDQKAKDERLAIQGLLVDGVQQIEEGLRKVAATREALPEMETVGRLKGGKRVAIKR